MGEMREWAENSHTKKIDAMKGKLFISHNKTFPDMDDTFELTRNRGWTVHTRQKPLKLKRDFLFCSPVDAWLNYHFCTATRALLSSTWNIQWDFFFNQKCQLISQSETFLDLNFHSNSLCVCAVCGWWRKSPCASDRDSCETAKWNLISELTFGKRERAARGGGKNCQKMNVTFVWHANK